MKGKYFQCGHNLELFYPSTPFFNNGCFSYSTCTFNSSLASHVYVYCMVTGADTEFFLREPHPLVKLIKVAPAPDQFLSHLVNDFSPPQSLALKLGRGGGDPRATPPPPPPPPPPGPPSLYETPATVTRRLH